MCDAMCAMRMRRRSQTDNYMHRDKQLKELPATPAGASAHLAASFTPAVDGGEIGGAPGKEEEESEEEEVGVGAGVVVVV